MLSLFALVHHKERRVIMKKEDIDIFEKLHFQIQNIYSELGILSKKSPDGAINKFKLKFVNQLLAQANYLLVEKYKPFVDFDLFQEEDIPTNSDVVLVVSQYIQCLEKIKIDNIRILSGNWYWIIPNSNEEIKTTHPSTEFTR